MDAIWVSTDYLLQYLQINPAQANKPRLLPGQFFHPLYPANHTTYFSLLMCQSHKTTLLSVWISVPQDKLFIDVKSRELYD